MNFYDEFQAYYAVVCLVCGVICSAVYQVPATLLKKTKCKILLFFIDSLWFCLSALFCCYVFFRLNFPQIRLYMIVCVLVGMWIYCETLNIIIAFLCKIVYNNTIKAYKNFKQRRKNNEQSAKR